MAIHQAKDTASRRLVRRLPDEAHLRAHFDLTTSYVKKQRIEALGARRGGRNTVCSFRAAAPLTVAYNGRSCTTYFGNLCPH